MINWLRLWISKKSSGPLVGLLACFGLEFKVNIISPQMVEGAAPLPLVDGAVDESSVTSWFPVPLQVTCFHLCPAEMF